MKAIPDPTSLRSRLRESLKVALSSRDTITVAALRSAMSAIDNAEAVDQSQAPAPAGRAIGNVQLGVGVAEAPRRELSTHEVIEIVRAEVGDRMAAASEYARLGRTAQTITLRAEAAALMSFLETALQ